MLEFVYRKALLINKKIEQYNFQQAANELSKRKFEEEAEKEQNEEEKIKLKEKAEKIQVHQRAKYFDFRSFIDNYYANRAQEVYREVLSTNMFDTFYRKHFFEKDDKKWMEHLKSSKREIPAALCARASKIQTRNPKGG